MAVKQPQIVKDYLAGFDKSEKTVRKEQALDRVEDFQIECKSQMSMIENADIPKFKADLARAKRTLVKANKAVEVAQSNLGYPDFSGYISNLNNAKANAKKAEADVEAIETYISNAKAELAEYQAVYVSLTA